MQDFSGFDLYDLIHLAQDGNRDATNYLVEKNLRLIYSVAQRFLGRGIDLEDLFQLGCIGLLKAIQRFDTNFGVQFSTYAVPMISGEMRRILRDDGPIKVSRGLKMLASRALSMKETLYEELGREPAIREIAEHLGVDASELATAIDATHPPESLYAVCGENDSMLLIDKISGGNDPETEIVNQISIESLIRKLPDRERLIIQMRYFEDRTQKQVADKLGISQVQVSRLERKILGELKKQMNANML